MRALPDNPLGAERVNNIRLRSLTARLRALRASPEATPEAVANLEQQIKDCRGEE